MTTDHDAQTRRVGLIGNNRTNSCVVIDGQLAFAKNHASDLLSLQTPIRRPTQNDSQRQYPVHNFLVARFWIDLGRRLARLPSPSVCPALLVPARFVSHAPAPARGAARRIACACLSRPYS